MFASRVRAITNSRLLRRLLPQLRRAVVGATLPAVLLTAAACQNHDANQGGENVGTSVAALSGRTRAWTPGRHAPTIGSFAVYATEAIELNSGALITGCNVGVENTTGPFLGGGAAAYFNSGATDPDRARRSTRTASI